MELQKKISSEKIRQSLAKRRQYQYKLSFIKRRRTKQRIIERKTSTQGTKDRKAVQENRRKLKLSGK